MPATDFGREAVPQWPEIDIPQGVKDTVQTFYRLVDTESEQAFEDWTALFVEDGLVEIGSKRVQGHAGQPPHRHLPCSLQLMMLDSIAARTRRVMGEDPVTTSSPLSSVYNEPCWYRFARHWQC